MDVAVNISIYDAFSYITYILKVIGLFFLFSKFNMKKWWAIIPIYNDYKVAECAEAKEDGYVYCMSDFLSAILYGAWSAMNALGNGYSMVGIMMAVLAATFTIINIVYGIRICLAFCLEFECSKMWVIPWFISNEITLLLFGAIKKYVPAADRFNERVAADSGIVAEELAEGLTVNIVERSSISQFHKKIMLKDIHLNIKPGTMVLLLGGSGAGKTTFFNAVTGYEKAKATITLDGYDVYKQFDRMKYEIGFVPQQELLRNADTVEKTLIDSADLRLPKEVTAKERNERIAKVMEGFGLTKIKDNIISKQSGGQKKRISIAMEYISNPSLFILDEPDSGLDGILAKELMQNLHDISREGKIVIVVTHTPDRVIDLFDEVIVLAKDNNRTGRLVFHGPVDEARQFFGKNTMEEIVKVINRPDEGGEGRADELIEKFAEVRNERNK